MHQLRQPGDYLKHNRARVLPSCVHMFTAETNQKEKKISQLKRELNTRKERQEVVQLENSCTWTTRENRRCIKRQKNSQYRNKLLLTNVKQQKLTSPSEEMSTQCMEGEANPEQVQGTPNPAMNPTVDLHRAKEETIKEFVRQQGTITLD